MLEKWDLIIDLLFLLLWLFNGLDLVIYFLLIEIGCLR